MLKKRRVSLIKLFIYFVGHIWSLTQRSAMDVDSVKKPSSGRIEKKRPDKRKQQSSKITFKSYGSRSKGKGKKKSA